MATLDEATTTLFYVSIEYRHRHQALEMQGTRTPVSTSKLGRS
jgi:hypothetical protein